MKPSNTFGSLLADIGAIETLKQALTLYETVDMASSSMSLRTRTEYANDLGDLVAYLEKGGITQPVQVTLAHLRVYLAELERRGYKPSTRNRKVYAIKGFFAFLHDYALIRENVAKQLIPPQVQRGEPRFLSEAEYTRLLQVASGNVRDAAILELFFQTGLRLSELVSLSVRDVILENSAGTLRVSRAGGHATIFLNHKAQNSLRKWLDVREPILDTALFLTGVKKPMGKRAVQLMLAKYLEAAEIHDASVQTLRHTMAVHHLAKGTPLKTLAEILGDSSDTLQVYVAAARKLQSKALQENAL